MDNRLVKWILIIVVLVIWINMLRVSIPVILNYFSDRTINESDLKNLQTIPFDTGVKNQGIIDINYMRNPFARYTQKTKNVNSNKTNNINLERTKVYSLFNFRGYFSVNNKRVAILEARPDLGISGTFYATEGETIMNEKIVEIGENYVIIFKEGEKIILYEVK
ncbi:MAG: hypothetical protein ACK4F9_00705 [Brevinematia bacterium]